MTRPLQVWGYYASGAESEATLKDNQAAFSRYRIMPRIMVDVTKVDVSIRLFGASHLEIDLDC